MSTAREIAFRILSQWTVQTNPPLLPERAREAAGQPHAPPATEESPKQDAAFLKLSPRDRAFAFDLLTGILRWRNLLDAVIASRLRQPLETLDLSVRALLWLGSYQLLLQAGTSDYAAVDTTVSLARKFKHTTKAAGLVNAVLRGITRLAPMEKPVNRELPPEARLSRKVFARDFATEIHLAENVFPDPATDTVAHLAAVRSHPALLVGHLRRHYPQQAADLLLRNNLRPVVTLRVDADALDVPVTAGLAPHATAKRFLVAAQGWNPVIEGLVKKGTLSPQDPTAAKPVRRLAELLGESGDAKGGLPPLPEGARILDLCAGLGTKTVQLARAFPKATVVGADIDTVKLARLHGRAKEIGQKNIETQPAERFPAPAGSPQAGNAGGGESKPFKPFDVALVDVPCSNTGVMSKRVQSRWRWPALNQPELQALQRRLLTQAAALLTDHGILVYATCSIDPAENGDIVRDFLAAHPGFRVVDEALTLPSLPAVPAGPEASAAQQDGGYFAILAR
jgi:16S rRNA (cytosine967-C5)-methyltransferase